MLEIFQKLDRSGPFKADYTLLLTHDERCRARLKTKTMTGESVGVFFVHGQTLTVGETLLSRCGKRLRVEGAKETVLCARCDDPQLFARACYHLGNRHVKIQIIKHTLRISPDHVLQSMLEGLGLTTNTEEAIFIPENGAYHSHSSGHSHPFVRKVN